MLWNLVACASCGTPAVVTIVWQDLPRCLDCYREVRGKNVPDEATSGDGREKWLDTAPAMP